MALPRFAQAGFVLVLLAGGTAAVFFAGCERSESSKATASSGAPKRLWHCGMHPQVIQDHPGDCPICHMPLTPMNAMGATTMPADGNDAGPVVTIDPVLQQNMGVRTVVVTLGPLTKTIRAVGMLQLPEPGLHEVSLKIGGWIDKLYANQEGAHVMAGDALFDLSSPDLQVGAQELIAAVRALKALPAGAGGSLRRESQNMVDSSKRKLRLWDIADQDIEAIASADHAPASVPIRSPATGHVEEKMVVQGSAVQPGMKVMRIADHSTMWLEAQVQQDELPFVKIGQDVTATIDSAGEHPFTGKITFIHPHVDHMTRTLAVRMTLDNPRFELKPGMYATADIITQPTPGVIQVLREAVIDTGTRQVVFVAAGNGHFEPRAVRMGIIGDDGRVQIISGLAVGEIVVTSGQFLMDVESRTIEATRKMEAR